MTLNKLNRINIDLTNNKKEMQNYSNKINLPENLVTYNSISCFILKNDLHVNMFCDEIKDYIDLIDIDRAIR